MLQKRTKHVRPSIRGLNLNDALIFLNWIDYAKGINDESVDFINDITISSNKIYNLAVEKSRAHPFRN